MGRDLSELEAQIQARLRDSFLVAAQERLDCTTEAFEHFVLEHCDDSFETMSCAMHDLKGMGASFGFPSITLVALQVEMVLKSRASGDPAPLQGLRRYFDVMSDILAKGTDPGVEAVELQLPSLQV
jgi:chemotaxis protein histidine kinase CheA